ncbi:hypothetical protein P1A18_09920 [Staphylococcus equorum]|nr:hypothetical protein [Staphylococcus equorum]
MNLEIGKYYYVVTRNNQMATGLFAPEYVAIKDLVHDIGGK